MRRRHLIFGSMATVVSINSHMPASLGQESVPTGLSVEEWMTAWMAEKSVEKKYDPEKSAEGSIHLFRFKDPMYVLLRPIRWAPNHDQEGYRSVVAPAGFVTDFASIPRIFWSVLRPDGDYTYPAIIHDYLYWTQKTTRVEADNILKFAMQDFKIDGPTISTIFNAVRVGGASAWANNALARQAGERRILKEFPDAPTISWSEWKTRPDRFFEDD